MKNLSTLNLKKQLSINILKRTVCNKPFNNLNFKYFSENNNKQELKNLKSSLDNERTGFMQKLTEYFNFNKVSVVNHTNRDLNIKDIEKDIKNYKNLEKEMQQGILLEDKKKLDDLFKTQSKYINKNKITEEGIENIQKQISELKMIESLFRDKRYNMFKDDIIFSINACVDPKILSKILNFSQVFFKEDQSFKSKTLKEFSEAIGNKLIDILEMTEVEELLIFVNFFYSVKEIDTSSFTNLIEPFRNEIFRRLDREYYLKLKMKNPYIENDEIIKVLFVLDKTELIDELILNKIFHYISENLDSFSIKELISICLFIVEKKEFTKIFVKFFDLLNEKTLRRNLKVMSVELLYEYLFIYYKLSKNNHNYDIKPILEKILEILLKNDSINKELTNFHLFINTSPKLITKLTKFIEMAYTDIKDKNKNLDEMMKKILTLTSEYFVFNIKFFDLDDTISLINMLSSKKLIDEEVLKQMTLNFISNLNKMDDKSLIKLIQIYIKNKDLQIGPKMVKEMSNIYKETSSIQIAIEILTLFKMRGVYEFLTKENLEIIQNKFQVLNTLNVNTNLNLTNLIFLFSILSDFSINKNISHFDLDEKFLNNILIMIKNYVEKNTENKIKISELFLFNLSCLKFNNKDSIKSTDNIFQEKLNEAIIIFDKIIQENLKEFTLIEFMTIFRNYASRKIGSTELYDSFFNLIINSIDQFGLLYVKVLLDGLENIKDRKDLIKLNEGELDVLTIIEVLNRLKIKLELKGLELSVEEVTSEMIKETIREYIKNNTKDNSKDKVYKKLI